MGDYYVQGFVNIMSLEFGFSYTVLHEFKTKFEQLLRICILSMSLLGKMRFTVDVQYQVHTPGVGIRFVKYTLYTQIICIQIFLTVLTWFFHCLLVPLLHSLLFSSLH